VKRDDEKAETQKFYDKQKDISLPDLREYSRTSKVFILTLKRMIISNVLSLQCLTLLC